jgi:hypothetical protein
LHKLTGVQLLEYLRPRLLDPLGITQAHWQEDPKGIHIGFSGLHIVTESIAKFGQLYLQKGIWQGKQLILESWVETATREHIPNASPLEDKTADWEQGYGYQFWRCQHNAYRADGAFGQYCIVMPEQDAVLAITSGVNNMQTVLDLVWEHLLPAMNQALPENLVEQTKLSSQLANLTIPPVTGKISSETSHLSKTGELTKPNQEELIQSVSLHFGQENAFLVIKDTQKEHQLDCAYNQWLSGTTTFYSEPASKVGVSGAWTDEKTFTLKIIFIETPHCLTASFHFDGERLSLNRKWNVSFGPLDLPQLTGYANL